MNQVQVTESNSAVRGGAGARYVQSKIKQLGIKDIEMFYDQELRMWAVCQVNKPSGQILLLRDTQIDVQPQIMFWCKDSEGRYREPSDQDVHDIVIIVNRAKVIWDKEEKQPGWLADQLDAQDEAKDRKHHEKKTDLAKQTAKRLSDAAKTTMTVPSDISPKKGKK